MLWYSLWFITGILAAVPLLLWVRQLPVAGEKRIIGFSLIIAAIIYVGFALLWGNAAWVIAEIGGILVYGLLAWLGLRYSPLWLAIGWGLHPLWDLALHLWGPGHTIVPEWYAIACLSFDLVIAGYVLYQMGEYRAHAGTGITTQYQPTPDHEMDRRRNAPFAR